MKYLLFIGLILLANQSFGQKKTVVCLGSTFFEDTVVIRHHKTTLLDTIVSVGPISHALIPVEFKRRKSDKGLMVFINNTGAFLSLDRVRRNTLIIINYYNDPLAVITEGVSFELFNLRRFMRNNKL
ncbi:MAG: hypothetical protein E6H07_09790 [Bacteroidetes bacterium]|nr:MAG: hypothetical protein E6H07_09790 [Bacteroidota bacterium]